MAHLITLTPALARRLAITRQHLAEGGARPTPSPDNLLDVVRDLGCLQIDPTSMVARSHLLVLWSRFGVYDPAHLDQLLWQDRRLFEYWAHAASIVLTEDYPIHNYRMRQNANKAGWSKKTQAWFTKNDPLRRRILSQLRRRGPARSRDFESDVVAGWYSSGWTSGRNVSQMLYILWAQGKIMVAGRSGGHKYWDLSERCLPEWTPRERLSEYDIVRRATEKSLCALGVATAKQIKQHFTRNRYFNLPRMLADLESEGRIVRAEIRDEGRAWPGEWWMHADDAPTLERLRDGDWTPRTTLLSPFDNLICDRDRTERHFDFHFRLEIYTPKAKRKYGFFVMPILRGDKLIGRVDPEMDREHDRLTINAVHAESGAPKDRETAQSIANTISELGAFLGAKEIVYGKRVPDHWRQALHLQT